MKTRFAILFISVIVLYACQTNKDKLQGKWIEADNFVDPYRLTFSDFSVKMESNIFNGEKLYHIRKDTLYISGFDSIYKSLIVFDNEHLKLIDIEGDIIIEIYERDSFKDLVDYFNHKKKLSVNLPQLRSDFKATDYSYHNTLFADWQNNKLLIFFNGKAHTLSDTSYLLIDKKEWATRTLLYFDKEVRVGVLNRIKNELQRAQLNAVGFAATDDSGNRTIIGTLLPPLYSIGGRSLPPPLNLINRKADNIMVCVKPDSLTINGNNSDWGNCKDAVKRLIKSNHKSIIRVELDETLSYETYLNCIVELQNAYIELRNEYAMVTYEVDNYLELESEQIKEVRSQYPMRIHELIKEE
ncbi:hypothetical protein KEM09_18800 [Carboxylicivirga mesophila]|uniref:Lipoprotein n=1 Tax=Carboxylicivirga mesophila TaxID=1166478 RepID=A0ABS5KG10_9BACT|nr:hypothetical protein [Carboxylicivirga mesophila]MBS2213466.1 hypothetical protein [Carboxylicivirga mesophila]